MTKCHFGVSCFFIDVNKKQSLIWHNSYAKKILRQKCINIFKIK